MVPRKKLEGRRISLKRTRELRTRKVKKLAEEMDINLIIGETELGPEVERVGGFVGKRIY